MAYICVMYRRDTPRVGIDRGAVDHRDARARTAPGWRRAAPSRCGSRAVVRTRRRCPPVGPRPPLRVRVLVIETELLVRGRRRQRPALLLREERVENVMRDRAPRSARACRARGRRRRQSAGCRAARRTRTSRCRAGPCRAGRGRRPRCCEITCAVPVLPETSWPWIRARPPVPPALTTIHSPSRMACSFSGSISHLRLRRRRRHRLPPGPIVDGLEKVRRDARAAVGQRRHVDGHRHRRHRHRALADADRDGFARVPLLVHLLALPLGRRHEPLDFVRQIDAALHAETERGRPLVDLVDADHVARPCRSTRRTTARSRGARSIEPWPRPSSSTERAAVEGRVRRRSDAWKSGVMTPSSSARERDRHLEGRAGRIASLNGAIVQRLELVGVERRPRRAIDAGRKRVRVVRGHAGERQHLARLRDRESPPRR